MHLLKETNRVLKGECWRARGTFDRVVGERPVDLTHFTDEETEALRGVATCPSTFC